MRSGAAPKAGTGSGRTAPAHAVPQEVKEGTDAPNASVRPVAAAVYHLPVRTRLPLKFGSEVLDRVTCARVRLEVAGPRNARAVGWGETPLSVQWVWPSAIPYAERHAALLAFTGELAALWAAFPHAGHPLEIGHRFLEEVLPDARARFNRRRAGREPLPQLAALVCCSPFDLALHDAFGMVLGLPTYDTYGPEFLPSDLTPFLDNDPGEFAGRHLSEYLVRPRPDTLVAWHLVGGQDPLEPADLRGGEPQDGVPVLLRDWIRQDGLRCLKVKLRGTDAAWDFQRLMRVGGIAIEAGCTHLSADFNCTVDEPAYVADILDRLAAEAPEVHRRLLYVEQPFPYDLERFGVDVRPLAARKPIFLDESAHTWRLVRLGRALGWTGVALKTCKTQTGALLSLAWAKQHGMALMVQDLTNPMLAQIPHLLLGAHAGTIQGVETNAMQFYPEASALEARVHPGVYRRRRGCVDLSTLTGPGFGYQVESVARPLPAPAVLCG